MADNGAFAGSGWEAKLEQARKTNSDPKREALLKMMEESYRRAAAEGRLRDPDQADHGPRRASSGSRRAGGAYRQGGSYRKPAAAPASRPSVPDGEAPSGDPAGQKVQALKDRWNGLIPLLAASASATAPSDSDMIDLSAAMPSLSSVIASLQTMLELAVHPLDRDGDDFNNPDKDTVTSAAIDVSVEEDNDSPEAPHALGEAVTQGAQDEEGQQPGPSGGGARGGYARNRYSYRNGFLKEIYVPAVGILRILRPDSSAAQKTRGLLDEGDLDGITGGEVQTRVSAASAYDLGRLLTGLRSSLADYSYSAFGYDFSRDAGFLSAIDGAVRGIKDAAGEKFALHDSIMGILTAMSGSRALLGESWVKRFDRDSGEETFDLMSLPRPGSPFEAVALDGPGLAESAMRNLDAAAGRQPDGSYSGGNGSLDAYVSAVDARMLQAVSRILGPGIPARQVIEDAERSVLSVASLLGMAAGRDYSGMVPSRSEADAYRVGISADALLSRFSDDEAMHDAWTRYSAAYEAYRQAKNSFINPLKELVSPEAGPDGPVLSEAGLAGAAATAAVSRGSSGAMLSMILSSAEKAGRWPDGVSAESLLAFIPAGKAGARLVKKGTGPASGMDRADFREGLDAFASRLRRSLIEPEDAVSEARAACDFIEANRELAGNHCIDAAPFMMKAAEAYAAGDGPGAMRELSQAEELWGSGSARAAVEDAGGLDSARAYIRALDAAFASGKRSDLSAAAGLSHQAHAALAGTDAQGSPASILEAALALNRSVSLKVKVSGCPEGLSPAAEDAAARAEEGLEAAMSGLGSYVMVPEAAVRAQYMEGASGAFEGRIRFLRSAAQLASAGEGDRLRDMVSAAMAAGSPEWLFGRQGEADPSFSASAKALKAIASGSVTEQKLRSLAAAAQKDIGAASGALASAAGSYAAEYAASSGRAGALLGASDALIAAGKEYNRTAAGLLAGSMASFAAANLGTMTEEGIASARKSLEAMIWQSASARKVSEAEGTEPSGLDGARLDYAFKAGPAIRILPSDVRDAVLSRFPEASAAILEAHADAATFSAAAGESPEETRLRFAALKDEASAALSARAARLEADAAALSASSAEAGSLLEKIKADGLMDPLAQLRLGDRFMEAARMLAGFSVKSKECPGMSVSEHRLASDSIDAADRSLDELCRRCPLETFDRALGFCSVISDARRSSQSPDFAAKAAGCIEGLGAIIAGIPESDGDEYGKGKAGMLHARAAAILGRAGDPASYAADARDALRAIGANNPVEAGRWRLADGYVSHLLSRAEGKAGAPESLAAMKEACLGIRAMGPAAQRLCASERKAGRPAPDPETIVAAGEQFRDSACAGLRRRAAIDGRRAGEAGRAAEAIRSDAFAAETAVAALVPCIGAETEGRLRAFAMMCDSLSRMKTGREAADAVLSALRESGASAAKAERLQLMAYDFRDSQAGAPISQQIEAFKDSPLARFAPMKGLAAAAAMKPDLLGGVLRAAGIDMAQAVLNNAPESPAWGIDGVSAWVSESEAYSENAPSRERKAGAGGIDEKRTVLAIVSGLPESRDSNAERDVSRTVPRMKESASGSRVLRENAFAARTRSSVMLRFPPSQDPQGAADRWLHKACMVLGGMQKDFRVRIDGQSSAVHVECPARQFSAEEMSKVAFRFRNGEAIEAVPSAMPGWQDGARDSRARGGRTWRKR